MFGYSIKKKSKSQEIVDQILVLTPLLMDNCMAASDLKVIAQEKLKDLIKKL